MKEQEPPFRRIIYDRRGNLSTITGLDQEKADGFMRAGDMRRDIVIVDSDVRPEPEAVSVGSGVLAWRAFKPLKELTEVSFKPKPLHTLTREDGTFRVAVHERVIDDNVRKGHYIDRSDYEEKFLSFLNKAVKSGLGEALLQEKLGLHDEWSPYLVEGWILISVWGGNLRSPEPPDALLTLSSLFVVAHPVMQLSLRLLLPVLGFQWEDLPYVRRSWKEAWLPVIPADKWILGRVFLVRHGDKMIVLQNEKS